jgi:glycosyltransferase involved in cell wall biosynthesis
MLLSVSMIVKDEEMHLHRCLASIRNLADEIIVLDTGSTDHSREIAESFGAKVFPFRWCDDFAAARNASLSHCTGDWVLVLDADEAIDPADHASLRALLNDNGPQAYRFCCRNYVSDAGQRILDTPPVRNTSHYETGRPFSHYVDYVIHTRLFRRFPDIRFTGKVHEVVDPYFENRGLPVGQATAVLHHFGKLDHQREAHKKDFYLALCEKEVRDNPDNYLSVFNLIIQSKVAEKWSLCLEAVAKFVALQEKVPVLVLMAAGISHLHLGDTKAAEFWFDKVLTLDSSHAEALALKAQCLVNGNKLEPACLLLENVISAHPGYVVPYIQLADLWMKQGKPAQSKETLLRGVRANPEEEILYTKLIQLDHEQGEVLRAASSAALAISALPRGGGGLWHHLLVVGLLLSGKKMEAASVAELGCMAFPKNESLARLRQKCANNAPHTAADDSVLER